MEQTFNRIIVNETLTHRILWEFPLNIDLWHQIIGTAKLMINSLWPSDAIWRQRFESTLAQAMACSLTAPSHNLNQYWLLISKIQWHSYECHFPASIQANMLYSESDNQTFKITATSPRGQWVDTNYFLVNLSEIWPCMALKAKYHELPIQSRLQRWYTKIYEESMIHFKTFIQAMYNYIHFNCIQYNELQFGRSYSDKSQI